MKFLEFFFKFLKFEFFLDISKFFDKQQVKKKKKKKEKRKKKERKKTTTTTTTKKETVKNKKGKSLASVELISLQEKKTVLGKRI